MTELTALVAFHTTQYLESVRSMLTRRGYHVTTAATLPEFQERSGERVYDLYAMDVNIGYPGRIEFDAVLALYTTLKPKVDSRDILFYSSSGSYEVVEAAIGCGIPAITKTELSDKIREIPIPSS